MLEVTTSLLYLALSLAVTIWVGTTLFRHGRVFLVDAFLGNAAMADSVNHLLRIGFYLLNVGFIGLFLNTGGAPHSVAQVVRQLSWQLGVVMLVLGVVHLFNMKVISGMRNRALQRQQPTPTPTFAPPPVTQPS